MLPTRSFLAALAPAALLIAVPAFAEGAAPSALSAEQAAEVRNIVKDVLSDADQRASSADGMTAGIDDKGSIFLKSEDGKFTFTPKGRIEFRYLFNSQNNRSNPEGETTEGFQLRRAQLWFNGHVGNPKVQYEFMIAADRDTGGMALADANMRCELTDELAVKFGKFKQPFAREELISSGNQLMVDRSAVLEMYTLDRGNAVQLEYGVGQVGGRLAVHSGGNSESQSSFHNEAVDYAVASRWELLALGTQKDMIDNVALVKGDRGGLLFGVAADFEKLKPGTTLGPPIAAGKTTGLAADPNIDSVFSYTGDVTYKVANWAFNVAAFGSHADGVRGKFDGKSYGITASADYRINEAVDVFAHWQMADDGDFHPTTTAGAPPVTTINPAKDADNDRLYAIAVGANYRLNSRLRFTGDVTYFYETNTQRSPYPLNGDPMSSGLGHINKNNGNDSQVVVRLQAQLQF